MKNLEEERLGEIRKSKESLGGYTMKIIEYNGRNNIWIEFQDENKSKVHTQYGNFEKGNVKNPYHPSVFGVGYYGVGKYKSRGKDKKKTIAYKSWIMMLQRCYDPYTINKRLTYIDCYVCDEWLCFQNFAEWYYKNYYECNNEEMHLDKDILIKGNKIYSPETCVFVPQRINSLFTKSDASRGKYPIGVSWHKASNKFMTQCSIFDKENNKKQMYLGYYNTSEEAFLAYKQFKENYIKQVADEYKELIPNKLYDALYRYEVNIGD